MCGGASDEAGRRPEGECQQVQSREETAGWAGKGCNPWVGGEGWEGRS